MLEAQINSKQISAPKFPFLNLFFFFIFLMMTNQYHHSFVIVQAQNTFIYAGCSQEKYQPNSPYQTNLNSLLSSIASSSSQSLYNSFAIGNDTSAAFGLYQCREDLKLRDCTTCISNIINQIELLCPYTDGATLQLDGCFIRYEDSDFLGKMDTSLRYKKCSNSDNNDVEFVRRRDDVLADLQGAMSFRVSATGAVEGYAQCLGDLGAGSDCSGCLADAVMKVKSLCGSAAAGEVYLGQCYVRYWEAGYYDHASPDSSNQDEAGKTVAIIVGVVAGIALVIVLLSLCKNSLCK